MPERPGQFRTQTVLASIIKSSIDESAIHAAACNRIRSVSGALAAVKVLR